MRLRLILQTLAAQPWLTAFKVLALGVGLAIGSFLLMRVEHDHSIDRCFPDYGRIYQLWTVIDEDGKPQLRLPGVLNGAFPDEIRRKLDKYVETVTLTNGSLTCDLTTDDGKTETATIHNIDKFFFDTFGLKILAGRKSVDGLGEKAIWFNSEEAQRFFGNDSPEGHSLKVSSMAGKAVGTFETIPEESTLANLTILSLNPEASEHGGKTYAKLKKGADAAEFNRELAKLWQSVTPDTEGMSMTVEAAPLTDTYHASGQMQRITLTLVVLAGLLIFVTAMNYVLLSLAGTSRRAKAVGVQKCSGASSLSIVATFAAETALLMLAALAVVAALYYGSERWFADSLGYSVTQYVSLKRLWVLGAVMAAVFAASALVPGVMMARIPAAHVFRSFRQKRGAWKIALLALEIAAAAFALGLTAVAARQYAHITEGDRGFNRERLALLGIGMGRNANALNSLVTPLPYVEATSWINLPPGTFASDWRDRFYLTDGSHREIEATHPIAQTNVFSFLQIPLLAGRIEGVELREESWNFKSFEKRDVADVAVSRKFAERMGCTPEQAVGRTITRGEADEAYCQPMHIAAVCEDIKYGGYFLPDQPAVYRLHRDGTVTGRMMVRLREPFEANLERLRRDVAEAFPGEDIDVDDYAGLMREPYREINSFRILAMLSSAVIMLIAAMGLLAYLRDEIARRTKEIAVRKINGASSADIIKMLAMSVIKVAVPAAAAGAAGAAMVGSRWMEQFDSKAGSGTAEPWQAALALLIAVVVAVVMLALRTALANPSESLRSE
ncbi:MAG: hypothetical protein OSJ24_02785 [Muribaculaceae bacterium]|nr:hypothetical protein [Muribaculaceae bacterium]